MMPENTNKEFDVTLGETKNGKKIVAYVLPNSNLYAIKLVPGGVVPPELSGSFTNFSHAQRVVDSYLASKEHKDAKSQNS